MTLADWMNLAGLVVAGVAIGTPLAASAIADRRRWKSKVSYDIERFRSVASLTLGQLFGSDLKLRTDLGPDLTSALAIRLKASHREFVTTTAQGSTWFDRRIDQRASGDRDERQRNWHSLLALLDVNLEKDLREPGELAGVALQSMAAAYIAQLLLGLLDERGQRMALDQIEFAASAGGAVGSNISELATRLLGDDLKKQTPD